MTDSPVRTAHRLQPPSWRDSRLLVGVLLVLVATVAGASVVAGADDMVPMYAASKPLAPGDPLTPDRVQRVDVRLGDRVAEYLSAATPLPTEGHLLRELRPGELVPLSAVGTSADVARQPLTIAVDRVSAATLVEGSVVDVYVNDRAEGGRDGDYVGPERMLERVTVTALPDAGSVLGGSGGNRAVQVMVPIEKVQPLIAVIDHGARVTLVPVPGSLVGTGR